MDFPERLRDALNEWGEGQRAFERQMQATGVAGSSRRSLQHYLAGDSTPGGEWYLEASKILRVRAGWLAWGEGPRVPDTDVPPDFFESCAPPGLSAIATPLVKHAWAEAVFGLANADPSGPPGESDPRLARLGRGILHHAVDLLQRLQRDGSTTDRVTFQSSYVLFFQALNVATPKPRQGLPLDDLLDRLALAESPDGATNAPPQEAP